MANADDTSKEKRKLKVIDWHMADPMPEEVEFGEGGPSKTGGGFLGWALKGFVVILLAGLGFVGVRGFQIYQEMQTEYAEAQQQFQMAGGSLQTGAPLNESFVSRPKAELAREDVLKNILDARRSIDGSPVIMQKLLGVEKTFQEGERLLASRNYSDAFARFEETRQLLSAFNDEVTFKNEAMSYRDDFLVLFNQYEPHRNIAPQEYENAFALASEGRFFLENGSYFEAKERFESAKEKLDQIGVKLEAYVERQLLDGQMALAGGATGDAQNIFNSVLEIDPDNEAANKGLERAETLDQVYPMLEEADRLEKAGDWVQANDLYATAFELDPLSAKAQQGMHRTARLVKDLAFNSALVDAKSAAELGNWYQAIEAYEKALEVYPEHEEVTALLEDARQLEFETRLQNGLEKAREFEQAREWTLARDSFLEVLDIDPENPQAEVGLLRTGKMIRVLLRYEKLIELSQLEARNGEFQSAIRYFNEAMGIKPDYLGLTSDTVRLKTFLDQQSKPVSVTLTSDGRTWVSVAGYELLGKIKEKTIRILPGKYRIVGRRKGYEDVQIQLQVVAGQQLPPISVVASKKVG